MVNVGLFFISVMLCYEKVFVVFFLYDILSANLRNIVIIPLFSVLDFRDFCFNLTLLPLYRSCTDLELVFHSLGKTSCKILQQKNSYKFY